MKDTWINHSVYSLLDRIANFQNYFSDMAQIIAATCFLFAIGMACIKIWLQASSAREQIIKLGMTLVVYLVMLYFYPVVTKAILPFAQNIGYDVIFSSGEYDVEVPESKGTLGEKAKNVVTPSKQKFYKWLGEHTGGVFTTANTQDVDESVRQALQINIVDPVSGRIDLNLTFKYCLAFFNVGVDTMPKVHITSFTSIMTGIFYIASVLVAIVCYIVVLINYVMALIDYYFMVGFGLFFLPLSLWDGSKQYSQALIGNFVKILVKLMIISAVLFLSIMTMIDMFVEVYMQSVVIDNIVIASSPSGVLQFCCTVVFQSLLLFVITKNTTAIASMLTGGEPQMSFGEFAKAVGQGVAVGAGATMAHKAMGKAALSVASGGASALASAKAMGGSRGDIAKSIASSLRESAIGGLKHFNKENIGNTISGIGKAGKALGGMTGMNDFTGKEGGFVDPAMFGGRGGKSGGGNDEDKSKSESNEDKKPEELRGGKEAIPMMAGIGSKSANNDGKGKFGGTYNSAQWQRGNIGTYGKGIQTEDSASDRTSSDLINYANRSTRSSTTLSQFNSGMKSAFLGNAIREISRTHAERAGGNRVGNSYMGSIMRAAKKTAIGASAGLANRGNVVINRPDGKSSIGNDLGMMQQARDADGNAVEFDSKLKVGSDRYTYNSVEDPPEKGPSDNDAVDFAKEDTQKAIENK